MIPPGFEPFTPPIPEALRPVLSPAETMALAVQAEASASEDVRREALSRLMQGGVRPAPGWRPIALRREVRLTTDLDALTRAPDRNQRDLFEEAPRA